MQDVFPQGGRIKDGIIIDPDVQIIDKCLGGNTSAYQELVEKYHRQILNLIFRLIGDYHNAEDIAQDTFISAFLSLKKFGKRSKFFSWLYQIALNKCKDYLKNKRRTEKRLDEKSDYQSKTSSSVEDVMMNDNIKRIWRAINFLPYEYREVFILKHIDDLSYNQIQDILRTSITTLKVRVHRARKMLIDLMGEAKIC